MKRAFWILVAGAALGAALTSSRAGAQDDTLDTAAEARFKEGLTYAKAGKYEQARASFLQTLALSPGSPKVLLNLAISEHGAGRPVDALGHLKAYLASPMVDPKKVQELRQSLYEELWRATGHLRIHAAGGDGVVLDGDVKLGNAPLDELVHVAPGKHNVTVGVRSKDATVAAGETKDVSLLAEPPQPVSAPPANTGPGKSSPTGSSAGQPLPDRRSSSFWGIRSVAGLVLLGSGAVAIGVAAAATADESSAAEKMTRLEPSLPPGEPGSRCFGSTNQACADYRAARSARDEADDRASTWLPLGIGATIVGAGLVASAVLWPERPGGPPSTERRVRVAPIAGYRESGILFVSSF